ncbi:hypothetical protein ACT4VO_17825 [Acinetobacter baumannii]|uniref:hypothetical protein n=1 Tax=Acinetobacter TaxID=469 RepID=UPI000DE60AE5|nr:MULTISPECIES: hypothetical protein [Acinetobacter]AXX46053.1 hypothetical protein Aba10324_14495 [Acinetobacter baumannii]MCJ8917761.1 hypothetical protein [Acinetobacter baumannii]MCJ9283939.1 hypothetical protein [Acinetobacter baumannii]MCJ9316638.1 hypothetical protein [Acinetobacter baumannii]MCU4362564.1 hypothetical protein [Acinetobacter sp. WU_MDCI_Abxc22]
MHPEELFELFYKNVRLDMNPPGFPKHHCEVMKRFWYERFMNAYHNVREPMVLMSWAEAPQMWLAGYTENKE